jgi:hypothetical protein
VLTVLKWMGLALAGLVALALLVLGISWAMPIPAAERAALEAMEAAPAARPPQANAFAAVWLLPYDGIPSAQWEALVAEDAARFREHAAGTSVAEGRFATVARDKTWCRQGTSCLAQVRGHADEVAAAHRGHEALHERIAALTDYRYYRNAFDLDPGVPFPQMAMVLERTPALALTHVRGDSALALQGVCEDVSSARMLMSDSDTLLVAMVGGAWAERSAALFTDILAELPADVAVPPVCARAFLPPRLAELDLCQPMRGEFAFQQAAMAQLSGSEQLLLDKRKTLARNAWLLSRSCTDEVRAQIRQDQRVRLAAPPSVWDLSCAANAVGCTLVDIAGPAYDGYPQRMQDVGAQLRMAGAMLWLRGQPHSEGGAAEVLARLPSDLGSEQRPLRLSKDGRRVEVSRLGPPREGWEPTVNAALPMGW